MGFIYSLFQEFLSFYVGEVLCADMQDFEKLRRIFVRRLPRLLTDQTATIIGPRATDPVDIMITIVRELHAG
jgi:hypothetical protein